MRIMQDFLELSSIPDETLKALHNMLEEQRDCLFNSEDIINIISNVLGENHSDFDCTSISYKINSLSKLIRFIEPEDINDCMEHIQKWIDSNPFNRLLFNDKMQNNIKRKLETLCIKLPKYKEFVKFKKLHYATGNKYIESASVCDLRPIYNSNRNQIVNFFPCATLHIDYFNPSKEQTCLELFLDENDIEDLLSTLQDIKTKMKTISNYKITTESQE